ncbi:unnamed protein product [Calicophoron daubneyi]|uniref:THO complex subunit 6 n=1 Tax=Calicophoron daubneyi TaxID=300641 RepID=A0AAV2TGI8_CALDB
MKDDLRPALHTTVLSFATSPNKDFIAFGTNTRKLLVYSASALFKYPQFEGDPHQIFDLKISKSWHSLCTGNGLLFCGADRTVFIFKWKDIIKGSALSCVVQLPTDSFNFMDSGITSILFKKESDQLIVATGTGFIHVFSIQDENLIHLSKYLAHKSVIHRICTAGPNEFGSCSEDGLACFWDSRTTNKPTCSFEPDIVPHLSRPDLGAWLTTLSCDSLDCDWFATGGGPRLCLWNRRAASPVTLLQLDSRSSIWHPQTTGFSCPGKEPRIIAGGNSSEIYQWNHSGSLASSLSLADPPSARVSHIMVAELVDNPDCGKTNASYMTRNDSENVLVVAGVGPAIRVVSALGYPLGILNLS